MSPQSALVVDGVEEAGAPPDVEQAALRARSAQSVAGIERKR
jgi:hypothetical protein